MVRKAEARPAGVAGRGRPGAAEVVRMEYHRCVSSSYGRSHSSQLNELADLPSWIGHNYASSRTHMKYIGTVDTRSNLYIRPFEQADQRAIKELLDNIITEVCIMDAENYWHRRHIHRVFEKRQEERKRQEMQQRALKIERLSARQFEIELGSREIFTDPSAQLQTVAGMPIEPSTISLGGVIHSDEIASSKINEKSVIQLPSECDSEQCPKNVGLIPDLSIQQRSPQSSPRDHPLMDLAQQVEDSSQQRRSERSKKKKSWDEGFIKTEPTSISQISSNEMKSSGKTRKEQRRVTRGNTPTTSSRPRTASSESIPDIDITKRHCKCNQPYDPKKFYVGCDLCYQWFHGKCVGISERKSKKMTSWICDDCAKERKSSEQELYCVCQTPYNDSQFYVGCDGCEGWFHPQCVGITQEEAEKAAEYLCPQCVRNKQIGCESSVSSSSLILIERPDFELLWHVFDSLKDHRTSWPFREAVDQKDHPDYYSIIKKPMDLSIVQEKLERYQYHSVKEFTADVLQIFENARIFNAKDSAIYQCADILEKQFRERMIEIKSAIETRTSDQKEKISLRKK